METKNYYINFQNGDNVLIYTDQQLSHETIKAFAEKATGNAVLEVYHVPQEELQYYCIDSRIWVDTPEKAEKLKQIANS